MAQVRLDVADAASASELSAAAELGPVDELQRAGDLARLTLATTPTCGYTIDPVQAGGSDPKLGH